MHHWRVYSFLSLFFLCKWIGDFLVNWIFLRAFDDVQVNTFWITEYSKYCGAFHFQSVFCNQIKGGGSLSAPILAAQTLRQSLLICRLLFQTESWKRKWKRKWILKRGTNKGNGNLDGDVRKWKRFYRALSAHADIFFQTGKLDKLSPLHTLILFLLFLV